MALDISTITLEEALHIALKSEIELWKLYKKAKEIVNNFIFKEKLSFLIKEEKIHQQILQAMIQKMFPDTKVSKTEKSLFPKISISLQEESSAADLLEIALDAEKTYEEFYDGFSEEIENRAVMDIFQYLSNAEHGHYSILKGEHQFCLKDEEYPVREYFQYEMVTIASK